jgi:hypothetical protein
MVEQITFVLTSCGRFDLLERTLSSFLANNDYPIQRYLLIEDSGDAGVFAMRGRFPDVPLEIHLNDPPLGQMKSIDKAYATITTEYVFHCEDDWLFTKPGIIAASLVLLKAFPKVAMVLPRLSSGPADSIENGVRFRLADHRSHHLWGGFSFNPGLRRLADYHRIAGYAALGSEGAVSVAYKRMGFRIATLEEGGVSHLGDGRRTTPRPARGFAAAVRRLPGKITSRVAHYWWLMWAWRTPTGQGWTPEDRPVVTLQDVDCESASNFDLATLRSSERN